MHDDDGDDTATKRLRGFHNKRTAHDSAAAAAAAAAAASAAAESYSEVKTHAQVTLPIHRHEIMGGVVNKRPPPATPGGAVRRPPPPPLPSSSIPPTPPPRPESTLSARSRPIVFTQPHHSSSSGGGLINSQPIQQPQSSSSQRQQQQPQQSSVISLTSPRPGTQRTQNLYVDAPLTTPPGRLQLPSNQQRQQQPLSSPAASTTSSNSSSTFLIKNRTNKTIKTPDLKRSRSPILIQPSSSTSSPIISLSSSSSSNASSSVIHSSTTKTNGNQQHQPRSHAAAAAAATSSSSLSDLVSTVTTNQIASPTSSSTEVPESIICHECNRCRCEACRAPRKLPQKAFCSDKFLCSAESVVNVVSCFCCVRGAFYHCQKDKFQDSTVLDKPCSCSSDRVCLRWTCLAALSFLMPCLWCYLPLKGCLKASEYVYGKLTATGCRCSSTNNASTHSAVNNNVNNNNIIKVSKDPGSVTGKRLLG